MDRIYSKKSLTNAKDLRTTQTDCENILWQKVRAKRLEGIKFRRQVPIGNYIVDFLAFSKKLIIELDGSQHFEDSNIQKDIIRSEYLEDFGIHVVRIPNNEVTGNFNGVCEYIDKMVKQRL